ncbi:MAG TPA: PHB depolymerase family esterase [Solimonas sp.]|nr:PHB depolymerase family esterase [Solimonas sp.]
MLHLLSKKTAVALLLALGFANLAAIPAAQASEPAGCTLAPTDGTVVRSAGGRSYRLHVPQGLIGTKVPLLLSLHGMFSDGYAQEIAFGWSEYADAHNFIVAYPQGLGSQVSGMWEPWYSPAPDIAYLRAVVDDIAASWCVDAKRVHVEGHSGGATMTQRVACDAADKFAAAVSYDGPSATRGPGAVACSPSRPIAVGLVEGEYDGNMLYFPQNISEWLGYNSCAPSPAKATDAYGKTDTYSCAAGTQVMTRIMKYTSHNAPIGAQAEDYRNRVWNFLQAHPLP